jgi:hypothetical protein
MLQMLPPGREGNACLVGRVWRCLAGALPHAVHVFQDANPGTHWHGHVSSDTETSVRPYNQATANSAAQASQDGMRGCTYLSPRTAELSWPGLRTRKGQRQESMLCNSTRLGLGLFRQGTTSARSELKISDTSPLLNRVLDSWEKSLHTKPATNTSVSRNSCRCNRAHSGG